MSTHFLDALERQPSYALTARKYLGRVARRSGVPYINHIREGARVLHLLHDLEADAPEVAAFCLHPLFQSDKALQESLADDAWKIEQISPRVVALAMEYRRVANAYTIRHKPREASQIEIGPLEPVHRMLAADKIQNRKDFVRHIMGRHQRPSYRRACQRSLLYFDSWLSRLGISEQKYQAIIARLDDVCSLQVLEEGR